MFIFDIIKQSKNNIMEKKKSKFTIVEIIWCVLTLLLFFKFIGGKK
jgi:hypothetical protein